MAALALKPAAYTMHQASGLGPLIGGLFHSTALTHWVGSDCCGSNYCGVPASLVKVALLAASSFNSCSRTSLARPLSPRRTRIPKEAI